MDEFQQLTIKFPETETGTAFTFHATSRKKMCGKENMSILEQSMAELQEGLLQKIRPNYSEHLLTLIANRIMSMEEIFLTCSQDFLVKNTILNFSLQKPNLVLKLVNSFYEQSKFVNPSIMLLIDRVHSFIIKKYVLSPDHIVSQYAGNIVHFLSACNYYNKKHCITLLLVRPSRSTISFNDCCIFNNFISSLPVDLPVTCHPSQSNHICQSGK